jgi:toxin HigB-1
MSLPLWGWHPLKDDLAGHWAVSVNGNWRLTFTFDAANRAGTADLLACS